MNLTHKQRLFVDYYLGEANGNATKAARMAGYSCPSEQGSQLLRKTSVRAAIDSMLAGAAMSAKEVLARLSEFASADIGDYVSLDADGDGWVDISKAKRAKRMRVVKKLKFTKKTFEREGLATTDQTAEIELHSPLTALDKLAQYHRLYDARPSAGGVTVSDKITVEFVDASERPNEDPTA